MSEVALAGLEQSSFNFTPIPGLASPPAVQPGVGVCLWCNSEFQVLPSKNNRVYKRKWCSTKCAINAAYQKRPGFKPAREKKCSICGKSFTTSKGYKITCSDECSYLNFKVKQNERNRRKTKFKILSLENINCTECGKPFKPWTSSKDHRFCSLGCKSISRNKRRRNPDILVKCVVCSTMFKPFKNLKHQITCSKKCRGKHSRSLLKQRKTPSAFNIKFANRMRSRVASALKDCGALRSKRTMELVGCSVDYLKSHLEGLWQPGMNWENWGYYGWHIDHIIPCAAFDLTKPEEQKKCFHYTNLQPLWRLDNQQKNDRLEWSPAGRLNYSLIT